MPPARRASTPTGLDNGHVTSTAGAPGGATVPDPPEAQVFTARLTGVEQHDVALVLGSGWLPAASALTESGAGEVVAELSTTDLPGFSAAAVAGHSGTIRSVRLGERRLLLFGSRTHYYEGKGVAAVVHPVRTAAATAGRHANAHLKATLRKDAHLVF